tara:strand:+ start:829 stop:1491 length:663 start_codon:yes stop_codon:yes gene_type:complete
MLRYVLNADKEIIERTFAVQSNSDSMYTTAFNVFPNSLMPVVLNTNLRIIKKGIWGISEKKGVTTSAIDKDAILNNTKLATSVQAHPCIIPASGFYMWKKTVNDPLPFYVRRLSLPVLGLAGFYSEIIDKHGNSSIQFAVLTMPANVLLKPLEETMPCVLEPADFNAWLNGDIKNIIASKFKDTALIPDLAVYRVPDLVNDPSQNSKELIQPIPKLREDD